MFFIRLARPVKLLLRQKMRAGKKGGYNTETVHFEAQCLFSSDFVHQSLKD